MINCEIIGLFVEQYVGKVCYGHNCNFEYKDEQLTRYHVMCVTKNNDKVIIHLENQYGECGSGWCTAKWGNMNCEFVKKFPQYNYIPKHKLCCNLPDKFNDLDQFRCNVFTYSDCGDDPYYPLGGVYVNLNLFKPLKRCISDKKRPVWIFVGKSGLGKSYLAHKIENLNIFETDSVDILPSQILADVIILGNKYKFSYSDILEKIPLNDCKVIKCTFKE